MATPATQMSTSVTTAAVHRRQGAPDRGARWRLPIRPSLASWSVTPPLPPPGMSPTPSPPPRPPIRPGPRSPRKQRAEKMMAAIEGVPDSPNPFASEDGALLSQENGKVRLEGWVDALVLNIRWKLALMHADEVTQTKVLKPVTGHIPTETTVSYQPLGVCQHHRSLQLAHRHPGRRAAACAAGRQHRDREAAADRPARHRPRRAAHRREAAAGRAERRHRPGREHEGAGAEPRRRQGVLHRLGGRRQEDHGAGIGQPHARHAGTGRQRCGHHPQGCDHRRHAHGSPVRGHLRHHRPDLHERQAAVRASLARG